MGEQEVPCDGRVRDHNKALGAKAQPEDTPIRLRQPGRQIATQEPSNTLSPHVRAGRAACYTYTKRTVVPPHGWERESDREVWDQGKYVMCMKRAQAVAAV